MLVLCIMEYFCTGERVGEVCESGILHTVCAASWHIAEDLIGHMIREKADERYVVTHLCNLCFVGETFVSITYHSL